MPSLVGSEMCIRDRDNIEANIFSTGASEQTPVGGSASNNHLYVTITNESEFNRVYAPINGTFIHVLGEVFEVGSEDPVNDQLQGLRDVLKTGLNYEFGAGYGD